MGGRACRHPIGPGFPQLCIDPGPIQRTVGTGPAIETKILPLCFHGQNCTEGEPDRAGTGVTEADHFLSHPRVSGVPGPGTAPDHLPGRGRLTAMAETLRAGRELTIPAAPVAPHPREDRPPAGTARAPHVAARGGRDPHVRRDRDRCVLDRVSDLRPSLRFRRRLHTSGVVPRLGAPCAGTRPESILQLRHVCTDRHRLGGQHGKSPARPDHHSARPRRRPAGQSEPGGAAGHAGFGYCRVRGATKVAGMGPGGRARGTALRLLTIHGGSEPRSSPVDLHSAPTVHRADRRLDPPGSGSNPPPRHPARSPPECPVPDLAGGLRERCRTRSCRGGLRGRATSRQDPRDRADGVASGGHSH